MRARAIIALVGLAGAGWTSGGSAGPAAPGPPSGRLHVVVERRACAGMMCIASRAAVHRYSLSCRPDGGTLPDPARACAAVADLLTRPGAGKPCAARVLREPMSVATIRGRFAGRPVLLVVDADASWCGAPNPVPRELWALSAFPCDTPVVHTGGPRDRLAWARSTGCVSAGAA